MTQHVGRWLNIRSLEHYLQETIAFLAMQSVTDEAEEVLRFLEELYPVFTQPPKRPWIHFSSRTLQVRSQITFVRRALAKAGVDERFF